MTSAASIDGTLLLSKFELFSSPGNLWIVGMFSFAMSFGQTAQPLFIWYLAQFKMDFIFLTLILLISTIPTTYTTVFIGYYGDKLVSKFGRRKPVVFLSIIAQLIFLCIMARPLSYQQHALFQWALLWYCLSACAAICGNTALSSWFIESTVSTEDYLVLQTKAVNVGKLLGSITGAGKRLSIITSIVRRYMSAAVVF